MRARLRDWGPTAALVLLALCVQATRLPFRWNQITMAYAAYFREYRRIIELEGPLAALTTFVGIHPPGYSLLFLVLMSLATPPLLWMGLSGLFSASAAGSAHRALRGIGGGLAAGAVLALSPYRNAYGLEINNYPLFVGVTALQWVAFARVAREAEAGDGPGRPALLLLLASTAACVWTHALGAALPAAQGLSLLLTARGRAALRPFGLATAAAAVLCLPLLAGALEGAGAPPINDPPGLRRALTVIVSDLPGRYGPAAAAWGIAGLAAWGLVRGARGGGAGRTLALAAGTHVALGLLGIAGLVALGVAADHQLPYYAAVLPAAALLAGLSVRTPDPGERVWPARVGAALLVLCLAAQATSLGTDFLEAGRAWRGAAAAHPLLARGIRSWTPGSSLLLVQFPRHGDDDKDAIDPAWALLPWQWPVYFDDPQVPTQVPADPYFGQPVRLPGDRWLYTFATFDPERYDLIADTARLRGRRVVVAHYDLSSGPRETERLEAWAAGRGARAERGPDERLWVLDPP